MGPVSHRARCTRTYMHACMHIPSGVAVDPALNATHGYDFRNNVAGDTYVVLLGNDAAGYAAARSAIYTLMGPCPLLPDFAFGTW